MEPPLATNSNRWNLSCLCPPIHGVHLDPEVGRRLVSRQIAIRFHLGSLTYVSAPRSPSGRSRENAAGAPVGGVGSCLFVVVASGGLVGKIAAVAGFKRGNLMADSYAGGATSDD